MKPSEHLGYFVVCWMQDEIAPPKRIENAYKSIKCQRNNFTYITVQTKHMETGKTGSNCALAFKNYVNRLLSFNIGYL